MIKYEVSDAGTEDKRQGGSVLGTQCLAINRRVKFRRSLNAKGLKSIAELARRLVSGVRAAASHSHIRRPEQRHKTGIGVEAHPRKEQHNYYSKQRSN